MNNRELIYSLLSLSLAGAKEGFDVFAGVSARQWEVAFRTLSMHGLAAFVFPVVERMPQEVRPQKEVVLKFISAHMASQGAYGRLKRLADQIDGVIREVGVKCLLLKGLSLAEYYPRPETRKFLDIDLYAPGAESKVDEAFVAKGVEVDTEFYRHSHMTLAGVLVENHQCLLDVRGRERLRVLDADLKQMAQKHLQTNNTPGLYYPDARFSLIFNLHHAMSHFIYEGISFKFLVDWIYFLRREKDLLNEGGTAEDLKRHGVLKFAAVMSKVSVDHLGLSIDDVPECIRAEMAGLKQTLVDRFIEDLFRPYEQIHQKNIISERLNSVRRIIKAAWKPKEFLGQSAVGFVWDKFLPILRGQKFDAD